MNDSTDFSDTQHAPSSSTSLARLRELFDRAIDLPAGARVAWIAENVANEEERAALRRLLAAADDTDRGFLDTPIGEHASKLTADEALAENLVGQRIGAFRLVRLLGKGGMAAVFLGAREGGDFRQSVAIKLLRRGLYSEIEQRLFLRERQVLASLNHPNIARLFDGGLTEAGVPYLVMEYVDGKPITRYAAEHALDVRARLDLFLTVCRAVEAAHRALIVHRDIKPSNILVATDGSVKLLDFGIAKLLEDNVENATLGVFTPDYAAPEQITAGTITTATDVYALGVLLHELLLGTRPDTATRRPSSLVTATTQTGAASAGTHVSPAQLRKRLKGDLDNILLKALAPEPPRRYASAGAFADDVERHLAGQPVTAHPPSQWYRASKFVSRHKGSVLTTAAFLAALFAALGVALWQGGVAREQARVAHEEAQRADAVQSFLVGVFESNSSYQDDPVKARTTTAQQLLELGAQKIDGAMNDAPDAKVRMLTLLAELHAGLGLDSQAADLYRKGIDVAHAAHGEHAIEAFDSQINYADELHSSNSDQEAKAVLDSAQATLDANGDTDPQRRAQLFDQLGEYYAVRDPKLAVDYARKSVALYATRPPISQYAFALSHKAFAEAQLDLDDDAMASYRRAIEVSIAVDGERSPDLVRYYAELGQIETEHHDIAGGEESMRKAFAAAKTIHGEKHVDVAQCEMRLGRLLFDSDRTEEGFALIASARTRILAVRGPDDGFHTPHLLYQYGFAEIRRGRIEDGLENVNAAIVNRRRDRPGTIPLAQFLEAAALARIELGEFDEATRNLDEASAIRTKAGQNAPSPILDINITTRIRLALAQGDTRQANTLLPQLSSALPSADPLNRQTLLDRLAVAEVQLASGDAAAAIETTHGIRQTIEGSALAKYYGPLLSRAAFIEGAAELGKGDARAATPLLESALAERQRNLDAQSPEIAEIDLLLAESALAEGDTVKARRLAVNAERIDASHKQLGPQYRLTLARVLRHACGTRGCATPLARAG